MNVLNILNPIVKSSKFLQINKTIKKIYKSECKGYMYILEHPYKNNYYKVGRTKNNPEKRAKTWGYKLLWSYPTNTNVKIERISHLYLDSFRVTIPSINGKGKTEIEWFKIEYNFLKLILRTIVSIY